MYQFNKFKYINSFMTNKKVILVQFKIRDKIQWTILLIFLIENLKILTKFSLYYGHYPKNK